MDEEPQDMPKRCPTCQGRYWNVIHGKWIYTPRETVNMVCQTCGRDYSTQDIKETDQEKLDRERKEWAYKYMTEHGCKPKDIKEEQ